MNMNMNMDTTKESPPKPALTLCAMTCDLCGEQMQVDSRYIKAKVYHIECCEARMPPEIQEKHKIRKKERGE